jgi:Putative transposase
VHLPDRARATSRAEGAESAKRSGQTLDIGSVHQRARLQPSCGGVCWGADQRKELEHLCCYITRPAIANERLKRNRAGQVVLQLKSAFKDGTTHLVMAPLEFMQRLAALVPRPRLHLIRFHGVLAPNAKLRSAITPSPPEPATEASTVDAQAHGAPARMSFGLGCSSGSSTSTLNTARTAAAA